ncbi:MAG: helix-turn-helix transcriptional regulator [Oscillospiraceae bacterium]|nr:helix-turn-helix transcriptional regulator [Oscillospiraceae bacterium]
MTACSLVPLFGLLVSKEYPSRFIAPAIITIAMLAVIIHSAILEMFRNSVTLLNFCYLCIMVLTAMVFLLTEPYLIYAMKRRFVSAPAELPEEKTQEFVNEIKAEASLLPLDSLTKRELEVAHLISSGYTNPDIAKMLFISEYTVKDHAKNIYRKLGVNGRRELIAKINRMDE